MKRLLISGSSREMINLVSGGLTENLDFELINDEYVPNEGDVVFVDLPFLGLRGLELCSSIKKRNFEKRSPLVICMTDGAPEMAIAGFSAGADDCISLKTLKGEFLARVQARLNTTADKPSPIISFEHGSITLNMMKQTITIKTPKKELPVVVEVTPHECRIFFHLIERKEKITDRHELIRAVWGENVNVLPRTIDKHISSLREKLKNFCRIESVRTSGYMLTINPSLRDLKN